MRVAGIILAGGQSSRMGRPKEGVALADGRPMMAHVADALRPVVDCLAVAGDSRGEDPASIGARHLPDLRPGEGPFAGIEAALASGISAHYLIVTCDQPLLTTSLLRRLLPAGDLPCAFRTESGDALLPFPCVLAASLSDEVRAVLDAGGRAPGRWLRARALDLRTIADSEAALVRSINTPEELARLVAGPPPGPFNPSCKCD